MHPSCNPSVNGDGNRNGAGEREGDIHDDGGVAGVGDATARERRRTGGGETLKSIHPEPPGEHNWALNTPIEH